MQDLTRVREITRNYQSLQGLRLVPLGLFFVLLAAGAFGPAGNCTFSLPALGASVLLYVLIGVYYRRTFGRVQQEWGAREWLGAILGSLLLIAVWVGATSVDAFLRPPFSTLGLALAALLVGHWYITGRFLTHYLVMAAVLAGASLLPLLGVPLQTFGFPATNSAFNSMLFGFMFIVGGFLDHLVLIRNLKPLPEERRGTAV